MKFSIRDDDTCFFTSPETLEENYANVWDTCPIGVAVVPFHASTRSGAIPPGKQDGTATYPLGENRELVSFLREKIGERRMYAMLHGYSHRDEPGGYEFASGADLFAKVKEGRQYLEDLLGTRIRIFVPPHNSLSKAGYDAVVRNGLALSASVPYRFRPRAVRSLGYGLARKAWRGIFGSPFPFLLRFPNHAELDYHPLTPLVSLAELKVQYEQARRFNGWFCLATHYWEFKSPQLTDERESMGIVFNRFWDYVRNSDGVRFATLDEMTDA